METFGSGVHRMSKAYCPICGQPMGTLHATCPSCGYDFPIAGNTPTPERTPTDPAKLALAVGAIGAGLGAAWSALKALTSAFQGELEMAAVSLLASLLLIGLLGLFLKARGD